MIPDFNINDIHNFKSFDKFSCICKNCGSSFLLTKKDILSVLNPKHRFSGDYCSIKCSNNSRIVKIIKPCKNCNKEFFNIKNKESIFCSKHCSAVFTNKNKKYGYKRSKLEIFLENKLLEIYPDLEIHFNRKDAINSELDIYIPSLKLAFELNGIFHYEPIYGSDKLSYIQNNDDRKFQACLERGIELCIIDTSSQKYFKESNSEVFLQIIKNIINTKYSI